jgi:hypothetical protein
MTTLRLHFDIKDTGLLGDEYEYNARLEGAGSFGAHRVGESIPLQNKEDSFWDITLPDPGEWRGDENVWLLQVPKTTSSGHISFDSKEQGHAERDIYAGMAHFSVAALVEAARTGTRVEQVLVEIMLLRWIGRERNAEEKANKGTLVVTPTLLIGSLPSARDMQPRSRGLLLYGSNEQVEKSEEMDALLSSTFVKQWGDGNGKKGIYGTTDQDDFNDGFIFYRWATYHGTTPPYGYTMHEYFQRGLLSRGERERYKRTLKQAQFFEKLAHSAASSLGLRVQQVVRAIDQQLTQSHSDESLREDFYLALEVLNIFAAGTANCIYYTKDMRYPNRRTALAEHGGKLPPMRNLEARKAAEANGGGDDLDELYQMLEDFNACPVWGMVLTGDCEDMALLAIMMIMALLAVGRDVDRDQLAKTCPLVHSLLRVLAFYEPVLVHGAVTSAFVNSSGEELKNEAIRGMKALPNVHSPEFRKQKKGGHMWGECDSERNALEQLVLHEQGATLPPAAMARLRELREIAWLKRFPKIVFEGTAPNESWILGLGEVVHGGSPHGWHGKRIAAQHKFLSQIVGKHIPELLSIAHFECPSYYWGKPEDPDSSVSNFYRYVTQLVRPTWVEKYGPAYGTLTPVMTNGRGEMTRGVEMGTWLRGALDASNRPGNSKSANLDLVGVTPTFGLITNQEWKDIITPVTECVLNQMPLSGLGRRGDLDALLMDQCHPLDDHTLSVMAELPRNERTEGLRRHAVGWTRHAKTPVEYPLTSCAYRVYKKGEEEEEEIDRGTTSMRFYYEPYMLEDGTKQTQELLEQLKKAETDGVITRYDHNRDRPLIGGRNRITLTMYFKV